MYLAAANFRISSSGRMPTSLYAPKVFEDSGIPRASLIALLSRLCGFLRQLFRAMKQTSWPHVSFDLTSEVKKER